MRENAAKDVSRMLDKPSLRHMVELAQQQGAELADETEHEGHAFFRHVREGHGGSRPAEYRAASHEARTHNGRGADANPSDVHAPEQRDRTPRFAAGGQD